MSRLRTLTLNNFNKKTASATRFRFFPADKPQDKLSFGTKWKSIGQLVAAAEIFRVAPRSIDFFLGWTFDGRPNFFFFFFFYKRRNSGKFVKTRDDLLWVLTRRHPRKQRPSTSYGDGLINEL